MSTFTASMAHGSEPMANHTGLNHVSSHVTAEGTGTASSVFLLAKIPHGAVIYGWDISGSCGSDVNTFKLGTSNTESCLATTFSISASLHSASDFALTRTLLPLKISLTDADEQRFVWIQAVAIVDICTTASLQFNIWYTTDGRNTLITER